MEPCSISLTHSSYALLFFHLIALRQDGIPIGWCVWVEHPYIEKRILLTSPPEVLCHDVKSGSFLSVSRSVSQMFTSHWLKTWFCAHSMTYFSHQVGCDVLDLITADGWKSSPRAAEGMFYVELAVTHTMS